MLLQTMATAHPIAAPGIPADQPGRQGLDGVDDEFGAPAEGEGQAMAGQTRLGGFHTAVGRRIGRVRIHRVRAVQGFRRRKADVEGADSFLLLRRLYILRLRCRHSVAPPISDGALRTILPDIEEEIHRLRRR